MHRLDPESAPGQLKRLFELYTADPEAREALLNEARTRVRRWRWASESMLPERFMPFYRERLAARPRWLKAGARLGRHAQLYGLDETGEIAFALNPWFDGKQNLRLASESVMTMVGSDSTAIHFSTADSSSWVRSELFPTPSAFEEDIRRGGPGGLAPAAIESLECGKSDHGRLLTTASWSQRDAHHETFAWEGNQIKSSDRRLWSLRWNSDIADHVRRIRTDFEYDAAGRIDRVWRTEANWDTGAPVSERQPEYRRPLPGETIPLLCSKIEAMLLEAVPAAVRGSSTTSPTYALLLCYTEEDFYAAWPPFIVLAAEAYRARIKREKTDELPYYLWAPDEMRAECENLELTLSDPALAEACATHSELMKVRGSDVSGRKVLRAVAAKLRERNWSELLPVSDDFVIAAIDNSGAVDPIRDLKKSLTAEDFARLKQRGWV